MHTTIVTLDPLLAQLNGTLGLVYADTQGLMGQFNANTAYLSPETVSAVSQPSVPNDGNVLRELLVLTAGSCDQSNPPANCHGSSSGSATGAPTLALPALPSLPSLPKLPLCVPTPSPTKLTTPTPTPLPCPSISPPAVPTPSCMPATPKLPTPTPSLTCPTVPALPGVSLPSIGAIPEWLAILLGLGQ
jgi:hypothetical protein